VHIIIDTLNLSETTKEAKKEMPEIRSQDYEGAPYLGLYTVRVYRGLQNPAYLTVVLASYFVPTKLYAI